MKHLILLLTAYLLMSCSSNDQISPYELVTYSGDIMVEKFDSTETNENRYNINNRIYEVGSAFTYSYQYVDAEGRPMNFRFTDDDWEFRQPGGDDENLVTLGVSSGLKPMTDWIPDYNQTVIRYHYSNKETFEMTGLIENESNIWLHPPRDGLFGILQLSPYPTVKYPLTTGSRWQWQFDIGSGWGDERWATWDGVITNVTTYEITGNEMRETQWGQLEVFIVEAESVSEIGTSSLRAVYNDQYGFLIMDYTNIDGSKMNLELIEVED